MGTFELMLGDSANVHPVGGSPQESPLHQRNEDDVARIGVEVP